MTTFQRRFFVTAGIDEWWRAWERWEEGDEMKEHLIGYFPPWAETRAVAAWAKEKNQEG